MSNLAFYTFSILNENPDHPEVQGFFDLGESIFAELNQAQGLVRYIDAVVGSSVAIPRLASSTKHPERLIQTLTLWSNLESVFEFAYSGSHGQAFGRNWTIKSEWPTYVAWWVNDDKEPTFADAAHHLEHLTERGSTPYAFNFKNCFDAEGQPIQLERPTILSENRQDPH